MVSLSLTGFRTTYLLLLLKVAENIKPNLKKIETHFRKNSHFLVGILKVYTVLVCILHEEPMKNSFF